MIGIMKGVCIIVIARVLGLQHAVAQHTVPYRQSKRRLGALGEEAVAAALELCRVEPSRALSSTSIGITPVYVN